MESEAVLTMTMTMKLLVVLFELVNYLFKKFHELNKIYSIINNGYYRENYNIHVLKLIQKL